MTAGVGAFFDIDKTVLEINSGTKWISYQRRTGKMSFWQMLQALAWLGQYQFGWLDFEGMTKKVLTGYAGDEVEPIFEEVARWFEDEVAWAICTQARERIAEHRENGHVVALLTSATRFLSNPVAQALDVEHILCTELEIVDGKLTGKHIDPLCYGPGKVEQAETFATKHGIDLDQSFFYTDSCSDLPMLERVGEPRVINPDPRLRRAASERGWPCETWTAPKTSGNQPEQHAGP